MVAVTAKVAQFYVLLSRNEERNKLFKSFNKTVEGGVTCKETSVFQYNRQTKHISKLNVHSLGLKKQYESQNQGPNHYDKFSDFHYISIHPKQTVTRKIYFHVLDNLQQCVHLKMLNLWLEEKILHE
jgi:hypothetical protein